MSDNVYQSGRITSDPICQREGCGHRASAHDGPDGCVVMDGEDRSCLCRDFIPPPSVDIPSHMLGVGYVEGYRAGLAAAEAECRRLAVGSKLTMDERQLLDHAADAIARLREGR